MEARLRIQSCAEWDQETDPSDPPTEFGTTLKSYKRQSVEISQPRNSKARGVLPSERRRRSGELKAEKSKINSTGNIVSWNATIEYCNSLNLNVISNEECIRLCKISDDFPQQILFCIKINRLYAVKAYRGSTPVNLYDILLHSFQHKITTFSQISQILEKVENSSADIHSKLKAAGKNLLSLCGPAIDDDDTRKKLEFICT